MRFQLSTDQVDFRHALDDLLSGTDTVSAARAWTEGEHGPGRALWKRIADLGVSGLIVPEDDGGLGGSPVDLVVAHEALGHHLVVGPWIETAAYLACVPAHRARAAGGAMLTVAAPYALDADVAELVAGTTGERLESVDATRRLFRVADAPPPDEDAFDMAALACAAQLLGAAERVLADTVSYVRQREQFGRAIGSFQAVKHRLADVRIGLDFARPLVYGAALSVSAGSAGGSRDVSAAKAFAADAAWRAARAGLQLHGALGYTRELDLGLWLLRIRALTRAWGTPAFHRGRVLASLVAA
ncbi:acyl-CoA dehydrogenase family protein [Nocardioides sp.]|jgi:alkylation response protein AidB-like acyl-CoA dehydrogenase|uniref:acyl-CoA dehydrogenase family protein n=1 Tax=Nocardioides sp. TaxID=35761 RepID=UPI002CDB5CED|nr:acyl-CoA dehydrogenase family protein [Nocardioides sp.]HVX54423.1 acyl-CoA dehydrogenase family protein [Nocardioides sp.]